MTLRPATSAFDFSVARAVGPDASLVFRRQSGKPLSEGVPASTRATAIATRAPHRRGRSVRARGGVGAEPRAVRDSRPERRAAWARDIRQLYLNDYLKIWDDYLADIAAAHRDARAEHPGGARAVLRRFAAHAADGGARTRYGARRRTGRARNAARAGQVDEARSSLSQIFAGWQQFECVRGGARERRADRRQPLRRAACVRAGSGDQASAFNDVLKSIDALYTY